jgi:hypothetical protein
LKYIFAIAALIFAGSLQAQTWKQVLGAEPRVRPALVPEHGLALDGSGRIFLKTLNTRSRVGTDTSNGFSLNADGSFAWKTSQVNRIGDSGNIFVSRGFSAHAGYRVAWFEMGATNLVEDVLYLYEPNDFTGRELRIPRIGASKVLRAATDGNGGVLIVRVPQGTTRPQMERLSPTEKSWFQHWSTALGTCNAGATTIQVEDADFQFDRQYPLAAQVHVQGRCSGGIASIPNHFIQSLDLETGALVAGTIYDTRTLGQVVSKSALGKGVWLHDTVDESGVRTLYAVDAILGTYPLLWDSYSGPVRVDRLAEGALVSSTLPSAQTAYAAGKISRTAEGYFDISNIRTYPVLHSVSNRPLYWSEDNNGQRVVVYRDSPLAVETSVSILKFANNNLPEWSRSINGITATSVPQLRLDSWSDEFILSFDRRDNYGVGVYVEKFPSRLR